jgi:glycosyltransferase involved in cell wall biosynthesis
MSASSKRVLYVDHTAKASGGEIALFNLVNALDKSRITPVFVLASDGPLAEKLRRVGIETHILPLDGSVVDARKDSLGLGSLLHLGKIRRTLGYAWRLSKIARKLNIDLIHTNSLKADIYGGIAGRLARIPVIWHVRDNIDSDYLPGTVATAFRILARIIPSAVVANSQSTLARLQIPGRNRRKAVVYSGIPSVDAGDRMHLVHDGLDINTFDPSTAGSSELEADSDRSIVAIVGRIAQWKGQDVFLRAAADVVTMFPKTRFWIIGAPLFGEDE